MGQTPRRDEFISRVQQDLPGWPAEVIAQFLFEHGARHGWPPRLDVFGIPADGWADLFGGHPFPFWRTIRWSIQPLLLERQTFTASSAGMIEELISGYAHGHSTPVTMSIVDGKARFDSLVKYLADHGSFPSPPILLSVAGEYEVLDGFHRLGAYFHCRRSGVTVEPVQQVWVGVPGAQLPAMDMQP